MTSTGPAAYVALFGDSSAVAALAAQLSAALGPQVRVTNHAHVDARSRDLRAQLAALDGAPDLAVIVVGANDVTHHVRVAEAVRHLSFAAHRLRLMDADVVVGTCPDPGTVRAISVPLRTVARRMGRVLAASQAVVVRRAGGCAVAADALLPAVLEALRTRMAPAAGYVA